MMTAFLVLKNYQFLCFSHHTGDGGLFQLKAVLSDVIHSKSGKVCGVCFSVPKRSAEKVRKSRHENFASKVRKSIKSLKMHHLKAKCIKI